jgi:hypothetical protein
MPWFTEPSSFLASFSIGSNMSYTELSAVIVKKGRKDHQCEWCGEQIDKGAEHFHRTYIFEGTFNDGRMHMECMKAMDESDQDAIRDGWDVGDNKRGQPI